MKTRWAVPIFIMVIFMMLSAKAFAESMEEELLGEVADSITISGTNFDFYDEAQKIISQENIYDANNIYSKLVDIFLSELRENIRLLTMLSAVCIISGMLGVMVGEEASQVSFLACLILIATMSVTVLKNVIETAELATDNLMLFMQSLIPALTALSTSSDMALSAGFHPSLFISMQIIIFACKEWFLPMTLFVSVLSIINSMSTHFHITKLLETCRLFIKWGLGILMTVYIAFLGICGFGQAAHIGVVSKTVKYAIGNFIPLVGGVLSESAETVLSGLYLIKNTVGITGILAILAIALGPLLNVLATSVIFRLAASICEPATDKRVTKLISDLAGNVSLVFSILLMVCVMFVISIAMLLTLTNIPIMMR